MYVGASTLSKHDNIVEPYSSQIINKSIIFFTDSVDDIAF